MPSFALFFYIIDKNTKQKLKHACYLVKGNSNKELLNKLKWKLEKQGHFQPNIHEVVVYDYWK